MADNLVIVESPTKSKTIEKFLGKNYKVRASMGHLRDLKKSSMSVDIEHDFTPEYINIRGKGDLIRALKAEAKKADKVFLATDPDREGEAISWHLANLLGLESDSLCRVEFNEITKDTVTKAIKKPRTIDMNMVEAQQARRILDRIVGYSLSPLLWRKIRKGLSAGRVQSVAVKIVADRDKEIEEFEPIEYWTLFAKLRENAKAPIFQAEVVKYNNKKLSLRNSEEARAAEEYLKNASYKIVEAVRKDRKRHPAPPFTTSSMQQEANKKLNFSGKKTMLIAQQLYEGVTVGKTSVGLITYMRTDSTRLADIAVQSIRELVAESYGKEYCPAKPNVFSTKKSAQDAHEAIRPTNFQRTPQEMAAFLTRDQLRLYDLIWRRTVASQMSDAVYDQTVLTIEAGDYQLKASGSILKFPGYLKVSGKDADDAKDSEIPYIDEGASLLLHKLLPAEQHFTEPPAHYTEASLIKELEDKGIGRPSTYAPIIQTILDRGYVCREGKKLLVTELGNLTIAMLTDYFSELIDIPFSASMETKLDDIAENKTTRQQVLKEFYDPFAKKLQIADKEIVEIEIPPEVSDVVCDNCGRMMVYKEGRYGKFLACPGFPECRNTKPVVRKVGVSCPECGGDVIERRSKTGRIFYGCSNYPACSFTSWDKPIKDKCHHCGGVQVEHIERNGSKKIFCLNSSCVNGKPAVPSGKKAATKKKK